MPCLRTEQHQHFKRLLAESGCKTEFLDTEDALEFIAAHEQVDVVMAAIVGAAGLASGLAAVSAGKRLLLANKESLIMSGKLFIEAAKQNNADIIPIDSEHNAIFQCLAETRSGLSVPDGRFVDKLVLTASGGHFLIRPKKRSQRLRQNRPVPIRSGRWARKFRLIRPLS